jgi:hypothetical protein
MQTESYCECGCGEAPKPGNRYVHGHNSQAAHKDFVVDWNGCWVWQRSMMGHGYGRLKRAGKWVSAHRFYYEQHVGPIGPGLTIDHLCRNRACVNPEHLEPVTLAENQRRAGLRKLSDDDRLRIALSSAPPAHDAARYGVAVSTIYKIRSEFPPTTSAHEVPDAA